MRRYLKTLTEVLEITPNGSGGQRAKHVSESMNVQLDRWRLQQKENEEQIVVVSYELSTAVEPDLPGAQGTIVNTMSVLYVKADEAMSYGVMSGIDPIEFKMYQDIYSKCGITLFSGRVLLLGPTPLASFLYAADPEIAASERGEADPDTFGENLYDLIVADRVLSRSADPASIVKGVKRALQSSGALLVVEDCFTHPETLQSFSVAGLKFLLKDFSIKQQKSCGNLLGIVHKMVSGGGWIPTHLDHYLSDDLVWPVYTWMLAYGNSK